MTALDKVLEDKLDNLIEALNESFGTSAQFTKPPGGIFLWVKLPDEVDTAKLAVVAGAEDVAVNPGPEWSLTNDAGTWGSVSVSPIRPRKPSRPASPDWPTFCHREFGVPAVSANVTR